MIVDAWLMHTAQCTATWMMIDVSFEKNKEKNEEEMKYNMTPRNAY